MAQAGVANFVARPGECRRAVQMLARKRYIASPPCEDLPSVTAVRAAVAKVSGKIDVDDTFDLNASLFDLGLETPEQLAEMAEELGSLTVDDLLAAPSLREVAARLPSPPSSPPDLDGERQLSSSWLSKWLAEYFLFDLPAGLGTLYFLASCIQSLPLTASMGFLNEELQMPQHIQPLYFAVLFMPWSLKPLYGLIADTFPIGGYHFRPWLAIASAGSAACYLIMGAGVRTVGGAFAVGLARATCNAFAELMLGAVLVSYAQREGGGSATTLQAAATGCRFAGSFVSAIAGLLLYPCGTKHRRLSDRTVICLTVRG